jgi:hypothetical protein
MNATPARVRLDRAGLTSSCAVAVLAILSSSIGLAQPTGGTGSISGVVRDPAGASVPDAQVEVANPSTGLKRSLRTSQAGVFSAIALPPAAGYTVTVVKEGFTTHELTGVQVRVGEETNAPVTLSIALSQTNVSVEGLSPLTQSTQMHVSQVIGSSEISNLPINGRRVDTYVLLTPAVVPDGAQGLVSFRGIAGGNAFLTDGNDTSNQFFHENAGRTRISTQISQDAVQEFQVLSSGYSAEYGRASGGIINTLTRSGSNAGYGTAYWFFRNRSLNARDPHSAINPPERRNQAGASLGGRLVKDRLFYFLNTEFHRRRFPLVASLSRPPLFDAAGGFVGTCNATAQQCSAALQFLGRQFQVLERSADSELAFGKLDWLPSQRHQISASFNYLGWTSPNGYQTQTVLNNGEGVGANGDSSVRTRYGRLAWRFIPGSTRVNELRLGWFKDRHSDNLDNATVPAQTGLVQITVEGQANLGVNPELPRIDPSENRFQISDTFSMVTGRHSLKAGGDFISTEDYLKYLRNRNGSYDYPTFTAFAQDFSGNTSGARRWQTYSQRFGNEIFDKTIRDYDAFVEDQFRPHPNLTLTYGLRYDYSSLAQPAQANPDYPESRRIPSIRTNFAPRVGVSIAFDRSRSVLRTGYGIFYARYHSGLVGTFFLENGVFQQSIQLESRFLQDPQAGPIFPNSLPALNSASLSNPLFTSAVDLTIPSKDYRNPYTHQGDVALEHAFSTHLSLSATYLWSRGLHLTTVRDLNIGPAGAPITYDIQDSQGKAIGTFTTAGYRLVNRVNPRWRRVNSVESGGNSYYNALVVQLRERFSHGFEGFLAYTWSHAIDFNQGGGSDNIFFSDGPRSLRNGDYRGDKASSQLDQRQRLAISSTWELPLSRSNGRITTFLVNGWRFSQISTLASAQPATATVLVSGIPFPGAAFNSTLNGFGGSTRVPFLPASGLDVDRVVRTDARLTKILRIRDRHQVHLNFEAFNVFNHVADTSVYTVAYEAKDGMLRPVAHLGEGAASQGYPDGTNARRAQVSLRFLW